MFCSPFLIVKSQRIVNRVVEHQFSRPYIDALGRAVKLAVSAGSTVLLIRGFRNVLFLVPAIYTINTHMQTVPAALARILIDRYVWHSSLV
jgi:hypothetical protein